MSQRIVHLCLPEVRTLHVVCGLWLATAILSAQHLTRPRDIQDGGRVYRSTCALCHGVEGRSVPGVSLPGARFRHAASDDDAVQIILKGIPGTSMPANRVSVSEAENTIAYLRSLGEPSTAAEPGDAVRGKAIFEGKGNCLTCHRVNDTGNSLAPDLTGIGQLRSRRELEQSVLDPNAEVLMSYRGFRGTTRSGAQVTGRALNEDTFSVQLMDPTGKLVSVQKSDLRAYTFVNDSIMPSYRGKLSGSELSDLCAYLMSLKFF